MSSVAEGKEIKKPRRSIKEKNLEEEVDFILSQDESDEEIKHDESIEKTIVKTPSISVKGKEISTPRAASQAVLSDVLQTPRRSCRKSIKPSQDYDDIINRSLRSCTRSSTKNLKIEAEVQENEEGLKYEEHPKWTPAKVGRVSQKRGRKTRRKGKELKKENIEENEELKNENGTAEVNDMSLEKLSEAQCETEEHKKQLDISEKSSHEVIIANDEQEDAEECTKTSTEEDICIVFEKNINNEDINTQYKEDENKENFDLTFDSYLKSKEISISDLGLKPIKDVDEELTEKFEPAYQDVEEMPSLIICGDDEEEDIKDNVNSITLNDTLEDNNSEKLVENLEKTYTNPTDDIMEKLEISDDESIETPKKQQHSFTVADNQTLLSSPKVLPIKSKLPHTPKLITNKTPTTPKQSLKPIRAPTPYRNKYNNKFNKDKVEQNNAKLTAEEKLNAPVLSLTTLDPKKIVLRGIRKRSLSVCIDGNDAQRQKLLSVSKKSKQDRNVSFYSPANQTTIIDELDNLIAKSLKKYQPSKKALNSNVTTRRKRSISFDESMMSSSQLSRLPRPVPNQNVLSKNHTTTSTSLQLARTKLPNFAAIHQKNFQKMESLVDHVTRKQERSKNLINSATKLKQAQKNVSISKNCNVSTEKPKSIRKIDLGVTLPMAKTDKRADEMVNVAKISNLPDPRMGLVKSVKSGALTTHQTQSQHADKCLKPTQRTNIADNARAVSKTTTKIKPAFNLSTSLMVKTSTTSVSASNSNTSLMNTQDKATSRLQRHMDLFKGRGISRRDENAATRKNNILRGVRSNRRFELQMQHRRNMDL